MAQQGPSITGPVLSASAKDTRNKGAGSNGRQIDLSLHCSLWTLSSEQDPGLGYSGTQRQGLFLLIPVNDSHVAEKLQRQTAPDTERQALWRRGGHSRGRPKRIPSEPPNGGTSLSPFPSASQVPGGDSLANRRWITSKFMFCQSRELGGKAGILTTTAFALWSS